MGSALISRDSLLAAAAIAVVAACSCPTNRATGPSTLAIVDGNPWIIRDGGKQFIELRRDGARWTMQPREFSDCPRLLHASASGLVCRAEDETRFFGASGQRLRLPEKLHGTDSAVLASSSDGEVVIFASKLLALWRDGDWTVMEPVTPRAPVHRSKYRARAAETKLGPLLKDPEQIALWDGGIVLGYGAGEFGGWIGRFSPVTRKWSVRETRSFHPVEDIYVADGGELWVVSHLSHLSMTSADVVAYSDSGVRTIVDVQEWELGPADLRGVGQSERGDIYLLSHERGLVRKENGGKWQEIFPHWEATHLQGFAFQKDRVFMLLEDKVLIVEFPSHATSVLNF